MTEAQQDQWMYIDDFGNLQGPFADDQMLAWLLRNSLFPDTMIHPFIGEGWGYLCLWFGSIRCSTAAAQATLVIASGQCECLFGLHCALTDCSVFVSLTVDMSLVHARHHERVLCPET